MKVITNEKTYLKSHEQRRAGTCIVVGQVRERINAQGWPKILSPFYNDLKVVKKKKNFHSFSEGFKEKIDTSSCENTVLTAKTSVILYYKQDIKI